MSELIFNEEKHEYSFDGLIIPSVTQIIQDVIPSDFQYVSNELLEFKRDLGKKIHLTTELWDKGNLDINDLHPILKKYFIQWCSFREDYKFQPIEIELKLFHNLYRYAGRIDRIGTINNQLVLLDIKSGVPQKTDTIQTAAYELLYNQNKKKSESIKKRLTVYLTEKNYKPDFHNNSFDKNVFLSALTIYNFRRK